ncbi:hypothetical protein D187_008733 [Cystobacter fuscus DSM 2262]|uniref:Tail terminator n=1 Tax=Cystobacter fuscus (strain ATCC 25194 / DSM 2262 / NBRC 100088 / M29) TaxID=1242864 RepID=S9PDV3_CYSF2|nr:hypothetical protein [Cystobacter fuscus]EPX62545.1 hypothetical protein D187_008733 [Cystobacter fuscus DSM 2262]
MSRLKDVELDVARLLEAAGLGSLADGLPTLYAGPYPPGAPDAFIACRFSGGEKPEKYLAGARTALHRCTVTVLVRAARGPDGYSEGSARARAAWEALYDAHPEGYVSVDVEDGGPTYLGEDEEGRPRWSLTVGVLYHSHA